MPDHPATDPAKPGSKLAEMRSAGPTGFMRQVNRVAKAILPKEPPVVSRPPVSKKHADRVTAAMDAPPVVEVTSKPKGALADALAQASKAKTLKEERPWEKMDPPIKRSTYFARKARGEL